MAQHTRKPFRWAVRFYDNQAREHWVYTQDENAAFACAQQLSLRGGGHSGTSIWQGDEQIRIYEHGSIQS
jgi:hypothetical protein